MIDVDRVVFVITINLFSTSVAYMRRWSGYDGFK